MGAHRDPLQPYLRAYTHVAAIVQSSGMGKSRTVDELAKDCFIIPLNLQGETSSGGCGLRYGHSTCVNPLLQDTLLQIVLFEII